MQRDLLATTILELLNRQVQCVLATSANEQVGLHLMAYACANDLATIFITSYSDTQKVGNMLTNPAVTLLWDNRTGHISDHTGGLALTGYGSAQRLSGEEHRRASVALLARNDSLSALLRSNQAVTFAIDISRYKLVKGYSEIHEYLPNESAG
jgi:nitroimidazol reductase NimA-like FMN-containing flavoprotein (pyridoxamine 5'-phosphate oxidase superfamily)